MANIFTNHPHSIGESYPQHLKFAFLFGGKMVVGGLACIIHAIFPFLFPKTGSKALLELTTNFVERMPEVDDRVLYLADIIQKKQKNSPPSS